MHERVFNAENADALKACETSEPVPAAKMKAKAERIESALMNISAALFFISIPEQVHVKLFFRDMPIFVRRDIFPVQRDIFAYGHSVRQPTGSK